MDGPLSGAAADILEGLTPSQRDAVTHETGPLLVLAGPGSGKTRVITSRIAHLILNAGAPPWSVLALTFTNKAAREMRERVAGVLGEGRFARGLTVTTFHALCARLLRRHAEEAEIPGLKADYTIYDSSDQSALIKRVISDLDMSTSNWPPRSVLGAISNAKNELHDADGYTASSDDYYTRQIGAIFKGYERGLRQANAVDFDDLLVLTAKMLRDRPDIREQLQTRWRHLMIDEYQDTNHAQFVIASLLAGDGAPVPTSDLPPIDDDGGVGDGDGHVDGPTGPNICVVGDPDQSIYAWRGADLSNILDFEQQYPGARVITLAENFRSTEPVLAVADQLISHNRSRKPKTLVPTRGPGEPVEIVLVQGEHQEAELVADWFRGLHDDHDPALAWKDMAVFYRTNALSRVIEAALREAHIPHVIARGTAFFDREEVKSALAYLRVVANPADEVSLARVLNKPARGIGATTVAKVRTWAGDAGIGLFAALQRIQEVPGLTARAQNSIARFVEMIEGWTGGGTFMGAEVSSTLAELAELVVRESGLEAHYRKQADVSGAEADEERTDNLAELVSSAADFETTFDPTSDPASAEIAKLEAAATAQAEPAIEAPPLLAMLRAYLESVALVADADAVDPEQGAVTLMTLHAAKGLEFPAAAMIGLEEGLLPHSRAHESESAMEEERRLCFVGVTRSMRHLKLTSARYRTVRGQTDRTIPSRFLEELGREHVVVSDRTDVYAAIDNDAPIESDPVDIERGETTTAQYKRQFPAGTPVKHPQFGLGTIVTVIGGRQPRAKVSFQAAGEKTLVLEYARLTRVLN
ncbi:MAG: UvrD-helicase domain-containing protein [Planctomycetota bacterium]